MKPRRVTSGFKLLVCECRLTMKKQGGTEQTEKLRTFTFGKWAVFASCTFNCTCIFGLTVSMSVMFLDWQSTFSVTRARTAAVFSTCLSTVFAGGLISGYLMNKLGPRPTVLLGTFLATCGLFLSHFATGIEFLIITNGVVTGLGFSLMYVPCYPCLAVVFTKYQSLIIASCTVLTAIVCVVLPYIMRVFVEHYSWRGACMISSGIAINSCVSGLIMTSRVSLSSSSSKKMRSEQSLALNEVDSGFSDCALIQNEEDKDKDFVKNKVDSNAPLLATSDDTETQRNHDQMKGPSEKEHQFPLQSFDAGDTEFQHETEHCGAHEVFVTGDRISKSEKTQRHKYQHPHRWNNWRNLGCFHAFWSSEWRFLIGPLFICLLLLGAVTMTVPDGLISLLMDFAKSREFHDESTGVMFIMVNQGGNVFGRALAGVLNQIPQCLSILIYSGAGIVTSATIIALMDVWKLEIIATLLFIMGVGNGAMIAIIPKCILDIDSVDSKSYPLAFGAQCTCKGISSFAIPILMSHVVDETESYFLPLLIFGSLALVVAAVSFLVFWFIKQKKSPEFVVKTHDMQNENE